MNTLNIALAFICLSALCLVLAGQIDRAQERDLARRAQAWDGLEVNDGENFV